MIDQSRQTVSFKVPKAVTKSILTIDTFLGCDFTNSAATVNEYQSPNCVNLIRDVPGKVRKCMGYEVIEKYASNHFNFSENVTSSGVTVTKSSNNYSFKLNGTPDNAGLTISPSEPIELEAGTYNFSCNKFGTPKLAIILNDGVDNVAEIGNATGMEKSVSFTLTEATSLTVILYFMDTGSYSDKSFKVTLGQSTIWAPYGKEVDKVNGYHTMHGHDPIIHVGECFYKDGEIIYYKANNHRSQSWQFEDKVVIADGKALLIYDGTNLVTAESIAYIPTLTIAKDPDGGGKDYEALNLLQPGFKELFQGDGTKKDYHLSFGGLDDTPVKVEVMDNDGIWQTKVLTTDYSVDRATGIVSFVQAPPTPVVTGEDNVRITAYRTVQGYADRINKCTIGIQYGVNGNLDRLFLSGNPDYINYDWYSGLKDPTYFPDTGYSVLGSGRSAIVGYSIISSLLAAHKDENEEHQTVILRSGTLSSDNQPAFKIANTLQGAGAIAPYSFAYLSNEPLFLTRLGIYAITAQDVTGEKYAQNRSFYLNGKMLKETEADLTDAYACVYNDMYWLCINNQLYILDGLQPMAREKNLPYSNRQYAAFYRTNIPANVMWVEEGRFFFGTKDGKVCRFFIDEEAPYSYADDGAAIEAIWETPDLDGKLFYKNKTFKYMAIRLKSAVATSLSIYAMRHGIWSFLKKDDTSARYFAFSRLIFSKLTFSTDTTQQIVSTKLRIKKVDSARFRLVNDTVNEPLGLYNIALEFVENGNFKG
jgi:hypothetical protein